MDGYFDDDRRSLLVHHDRVEDRLDIGRGRLADSLAIGAVGIDGELRRHTHARALEIDADAESPRLRLEYLLARLRRSGQSQKRDDETESDEPASTECLHRIDASP